MNQPLAGRPVKTTRGPVDLRMLTGKDAEIIERNVLGVLTTRFMSVLGFDIRHGVIQASLHFTSFLDSLVQDITALLMRRYTNKTMNHHHHQ